MSGVERLSDNGNPKFATVRGRRPNVPGLAP